MNGAQRALRPVLVSADQALVGQAVEAGLRTRGFEPVRSDDVAEVGLLLADLATQSQVSHARQVVVGARVPWVVVSGTASGPGWAAVLGAGAGAVLDSSCSLTQVAELLESLADGSFSPDRDVGEGLQRVRERTPLAWAWPHALTLM